MTVYYVKPRLSIGIFSGLSHQYEMRTTYTTSNDSSVALSHRWQDFIDTIFENVIKENIDYFLIPRLSKELTEAQEDIAVFLQKHVDVPLTTILGQWSWDQLACCESKENFVNNHTRSYLVDMPNKYLVMKLEKSVKTPLWAADIDTIVKLEEELNKSILSLYRTPETLQTKSVLDLPSIGKLSKEEKKFIEKIISSSSITTYQKNVRWNAVERLLATGLRGKKNVKIERVFSGASGAVTALLNIPNEAPVVAKIGTQLAVFQEVRNLSSVVVPKLQHYVSRSVLERSGMNSMVATKVEPKSSDSENIALTLLTMTSEPNADVSKTLTLAQRLGVAFDSLEVDETDQLLKDIELTMSKTVFAFHRGAVVESQSLWQSFGEYLPAGLEFKATNAVDNGTIVTEKNEKNEIIYFRDGNPRGLLAYDALAMAAALVKTSTAEDSAVKLTRMSLHHIEPVNDRSSKLELIHPRLGIRFRVSQTMADVAAEGSIQPDSINNLSKKIWLKRSAYIDAFLKIDSELHVQNLNDYRDKYFEKIGNDKNDTKSAKDNNNISISDFFYYSINPTETPYLNSGLTPCCSYSHQLLDIVFPTAVSAIHGDMNLGNIVFTTENSQGWLIDFERSRLGAPIAFDYAKLIIEMLLHHGIHHLYEQVVLLQAIDGQGNGNKSESQVVADLLTLLFKPLFTNMGDAGSYIKNSEETIAGKIKIKELFSTQYHTPASKIIAFIADFIAIVFNAGMKQLKAAHSLSNELDASRDMARALASYSFIAVKHVKKATHTNNHQEVAIILGKLCENFTNIAFAQLLNPPVSEYDSKNITSIKSNSNKLAEELWISLLFHKLGVVKIQVDSQSSQNSTNNFVSAFKKLVEVCGSNHKNSQVNKTQRTFDSSSNHSDSEVKEYWDVASTGGLANITPIVGYLLLMARRNCNGNDQKIFVPKISSRGDAGGTVDTLEAGGYRFSSEVGYIQEKVMSEGGIFCKQDAELTPIDTEMMKQRKKLGLMKSAELALASILGKKIPLGATHVVIDVKLGEDTKMLPRLPQFMPEPSAALTIAQQALLIDAHGHKLAEHIEKLSVKVTEIGELNNHLLSLMSDTKLESEARNTVDIKLNDQSLKVTLMYTNGDFPLCRATGRNLILRQLNELFEHGKKLTDQHEDFFFTELAAACGLDSAVCKHDLRDKLKVQWQALLKQMPLAQSDLAAEPVAGGPTGELSSINNYLASVEKNPIKPIECKELSALTIQFKDVLAWCDNASKVQSIKSINVNPLEGLFKTLGYSKDSYIDDASIGFWMHVLPSEVVLIEETTPIISVFFRPRDDEQTVKRELLDYLTHHYKFNLKR